MSLRALRWGPGPGAARGLVVLLHGVGADAEDLIGLAPELERALPGVAFVALDAPHPYEMGSGGRQWFSLADLSPLALARGAAAAVPALDEAVDSELSRLGAVPMALAGFSQGAMMALHAGLRRLPAPAAVLAYSGALVGAVPATADRRRPPVLLVHGTGDGVVPPALSQAAERALRAAGVAVRLVLRPGLGHRIDEAGVAAGAAFLREAFDEHVPGPKACGG